MTVVFQSTPTTNGLSYPVALLNGARPFSTLDAGRESILTGRVDSLMVSPDTKPTLYVPDTRGDTRLPAGDVAKFEDRPDAEIALCFSLATGQQQSVIFRRV